MLCRDAPCVFMTLRDAARRMFCCDFIVSEGGSEVGILPKHALTSTYVVCGLTLGLTAMPLVRGERCPM